MEEKVTISLDEYKDLIRAKQKAEQYKVYFLENTQNTRTNKVLCAIEGKGIIELVKEMEVNNHE